MLVCVVRTCPFNAYSFLAPESTKMQLSLLMDIQIPPGPSLVLLTTMFTCDSFSSVCSPELLLLDQSVCVLSTLLRAAKSLYTFARPQVVQEDVHHSTPLPS